MPPRLTDGQRYQIRVMSADGELINKIAQVVHCTPRTVRNVQANIVRYRTTTAPANRTGPDPKITPFMQERLCEALVDEPEMVSRKMISFLYKEFGVEVSPSTITRTLQKIKWTRKNTRRVAKQRDPQLQHYYNYRLKLGGFRSYHLIFIDESGMDKTVGLRRKGWAPKGITPRQTATFQREERYQVLSAYTQRGIKLSRVYRGSTDTETFVDFIKQLLCHCNKWPEPESVLVMDNATIHCSKEIEEMCERAGVKQVFTAPYTPVTSPIEEHFAELKAYAKVRWDEHIDLIHRDFGAYIKSCVAAVGGRQDSAEGHFRNAGLTVEHPPSSGCTDDDDQLS
jgi:transposase